MGNVVREFGRLLIADTTDGRSQRLSGALDALREGRAQTERLLISDPRSRTGLWELNSALLTTVDRMIDEFDLGSVRTAAAPPDREPGAALQAARRLRRNQPAP